MTSTEWAVRYRREGWKSRQVRFFQSEAAAFRRARFLVSKSSEDRWGEMIECWVESRPVGEWDGCIVFTGGEQ